MLHFSLSWHEEEAGELDRDAMLGAAEAAIGALGAADRQALIVCHDDEPHPHVHILLNRVSAEDGRMLSSSKEKLNLSRWAEAYEKQRGKIYCDQRVINNVARDRGEYTRGQKDQARHLYEQQQRSVTNDNNPAGGATAVERGKEAAIAMRRREMKVRHAQEFEQLEQRYAQRMSEIREAVARAVGKEKAAVRRRFRPRWEKLHQEHEADRRAFEQREETFLGRMKNRFKSIDLRALVRGDRMRQAIGKAFDALASKGLVLKRLAKVQAHEKAGLERKQRQAEQQAVRIQRDRQRQRLTETRQAFLTERASLVLAHRMDQAKLRAPWRERQRQRAEAAPTPTDERVRRVQDKLKQARERRQRERRNRRPRRY